MDLPVRVLATMVLPMRALAQMLALVRHCFQCVRLTKMVAFQCVCLATTMVLPMRVLGDNGPFNVCW